MGGELRAAVLVNQFSEHNQKLREQISLVCNHYIELCLRGLCD